MLGQPLPQCLPHHLLQFQSRQTFSTNCGLTQRRPLVAPVVVMAVRGVRSPLATISTPLRVLTTRSSCGASILQLAGAGAEGLPLAAVPSLITTIIKTMASPQQRVPRPALEVSSAPPRPISSLSKGSYNNSKNKSKLRLLLQQRPIAVGVPMDGTPTLRI